MTLQELYCLMEGIVMGDCIPKGLFDYFLSMLNLNFPSKIRTMDSFNAFAKKYGDDPNEMVHAINSAFTSIIEYFDECQALTDGLSNSALTDVSKYEKYFSIDEKLKHSQNEHIYLDFDLTEATTQALNKINPEILGGTWKNFISKFTDDEYIVNGRYMRIGCCGWFGKKTYETRHGEFLKNVCKSLICKIFDIQGNDFLNNLLSNENTPLCNVYCDTVRFDVTALADSGVLTRSNIETIVKDIKEQFDVDIHYTCQKFFIKRCSKQIAGNLDIANIPCKEDMFDGHVFVSKFVAPELPQLYKIINGLSVNENDIAISHGRKIELLN